SYRLKRHSVELVLLYPVSRRRFHRFPLAAVEIQHSPVCRHAHAATARIVEPVQLALAHRYRFGERVTHPLGFALFRPPVEIRASIVARPRLLPVMNRFRTPVRSPARRYLRRRRQCRERLGPRDTL